MDKNTVRGLLLAIGVSDYNATMIIPYTFITPSTTDPSMAQIIILTRYIQRALMRLGATGVHVTGQLDKATGDAISQIAGTEFLSLPWYQIVEDILSFGERGMVLSTPGDMVGPTPTGFSGLDLPEIPGGVITYGLGAYALWYFLVKKKRRSVGKPRY